MDLFCPGPVNILPEIKNKSYHEISHRGKDFQDLYNRCSTLTKELFCDKEDKYTPLFLTGSGTLAIESMLMSWKGKGKILLLQNGFFSEKWASLFQQHTLDYDILQFGWGNSFCLETIRAKLISQQFQAIFVVHHETSTTMVNDLESLDILCREFSLELLVDGVSSIGMYPVSLMNVSSLCMIAYSTNKCIGSYPGLSIVFAKTSFLQSLSSELSYLNLKLYYNFSLHSETPFTPCVQNFFYYAEALRSILAQSDRLLTYQAHSRFFLDECEKLGYKPYLQNTKAQCCWVMNLQCNSPTQLYDFLYKNQIVVYKCKGCLETSCIQVAILNKSRDDIKNLLTLLKTFSATRLLADPKETEGF
jgi:2-aminoethylphosphonate-pyruvate transaminase